jgi:hypothetical protein
MASNINTVEELSNKLDGELAWRRKEMFLIKSGIPTAKTSQQTAMLRSAVPFVYAHWEGFVKVSMSYYLEFVSRKQLRHNELKNSFITLSIQNKMGSIGMNSFSARCGVIEMLLDTFNSRSNIPKKNIINTKSNLTFDVLQEILYILHLTDHHLESHKSLIDDLVSLRNHIAHGEYRVINAVAFNSMYEDIISLMGYIKSKIENNAATEGYKRVQPGT